MKKKKYDNAVSLYEQGKSIAECAKYYGITRQAMHFALKRRGCNFRKNPRLKKHRYNGKSFTMANTGYLRMTNGNRELMHRYVWKCEVGPIPDGYDIHHINGDKTDNRIENLECISKAEHTRKYSPHNNQYGKGYKPVISINNNGEITNYECTSIAANAMGVCVSAIRACILGKTKRCQGLNWEYASN